MKYCSFSLLIMMLTLIFACDKESNEETGCGKLEWHSNIHNDYLFGSKTGTTINLIYEDFATPDSICTKHPQILKFRLKSKTGQIANLDIFANVYWDGIQNPIVQRISHTTGGDYELELTKSNGLDMGPDFKNGIGKIKMNISFNFLSVGQATMVDEMRILLESAFDEMNIDLEYTKCKSCDRSENPINTYIDIIPKNQGTRFNLSRDGKRIAIWDHLNNYIMVYNTDDGSEVCEILHPSSTKYDNCILTADASQVVFNHEGFKIKAYDAVNGTFKFEFKDIAYLWKPMPDGISLIGFSEYLGGVPLITKEGSIRINLFTGNKSASENYPEINTPYIAGGRPNDEYIMANYPIDQANPFSPTTKVVIRTRNIVTQTSVRLETLNIQAYRGNQYLSDDGKTICFVIIENLKKYLAFYDVSSAARFLNKIEINSPVLGAVAMGPGNDKAVYPELGKINEYNFRTDTKSEGKYRINTSITSDFINPDWSEDGTRLAAAYTDGNGKVHVIVWKN